MGHLPLHCAFDKDLSSNYPDGSADFQCIDERYSPSVLNDLLLLLGYLICVERRQCIMKRWEEYVSTAPNVKRTHYWDLKPSIRVGFDRLPEGLQSRTRTISVKRLSSLGGRREIEGSISYIALGRYGQKTRKLRIRLPLDLDNLD